MDKENAWMLGQDNTFVIATARSINSAPGLRQLTSQYGDEDSIDAAVARASALLGDNGLDNLILNAGTNHQPNATFDDMDFNFLADELKFNVEYPIRTIRSFSPLLRAGQEKKITIMSSELGSIEVAGKRVGLAPAYSIGKTVLNMMSRKYGGALKAEGITTIMLHPG
ncbi:hypothetical protein BJ165DRAFT_1534558 [Panaeolus papilionaceus]|nr:hypothetical protein BJ165DRAFT_1534558 [Panaeolus papilionaceus]